MNFCTSRFLLVFLLSLPAVCAAQPPPPAKTPPAAWTPPAAQIPQLGPEAVVGIYKVRPPLGYTVAPLMQQGTMKTFGWKGAAHSNGVSPAFYVTLVPVPEGQLAAQDAATAQGLMQSAQKGQKNYEPDITFDPIETGLIDGVLFARTRWKGHNKDGTAAQGIIYTGSMGHAVVFIGAQDSDKESVTSFPVLDAAVLTFHKTP